MEPTANDVAPTQPVPAPQHNFWTRPRMIPGLRINIVPNGIVVDALSSAVRGLGQAAGALVVLKLAGVI